MKNDFDWFSDVFDRKERRKTKKIGGKEAKDCLGDVGVRSLGKSEDVSFEGRGQRRHVTKALLTPGRAVELPRESFEGRFVAGESGRPTARTTPQPSPPSRRTRPTAPPSQREFCCLRCGAVLRYSDGFKG